MQAGMQTPEIIIQVHVHSRCFYSANINTKEGISDT